jgi:2-oxoglutarate ferredoxin oxidoreductase subunit alpha
MAREKGLKAGLFRPITVYPYPNEQLKILSGKVKDFLVVEMNTGQMVEDVRLSVTGDTDVQFYGRPGGGMPTPNEVLEEIEKRYGK